jgi:glycosyltransferase involved in cell wall biosynthesis
MLNIAFLDAVGWDYDVATPYERPLGGSQSALAYLAAELARRGARVTLYCGTSRPREVMGVSCVSIDGMPAGSLGQPFDAFVVLNGPADVCFRLRPHLAPTTPRVLWTQHAADQRAMTPLQHPEVRQAWDAVACVSQWHRTAMIGHYGLDPSRACVLRNAIAPCFEGLFSSRDELARAKGSRLILSYTSTPFRGLDVLLSVFPEVQVEFPEAELEVFSSMKVYQQDEPGDAFAPLYNLCRSTPAVRYVGSVHQPRLAEELKAASILAYPNTFAETSCIAVMEAMAAGLLVVTTDLGALPETTMGFGALVTPAVDPAGHETLERDFLDRLKAVLRRRADDPSRFAAAGFEQLEAINAHCTWRARAPQWEEDIRRWKHARSTGPTGGHDGSSTA